MSILAFTVTLTAALAVLAGAALAAVCVEQRRTIAHLQAEVATADRPLGVHSHLRIGATECIITSVDVGWRGFEPLVEFHGTDIGTHRRERERAIVADWAVDPRGANADNDGERP